MKLLANPVFLRAAIVFFCASFSFLLGIIFIRLLRKSITEESDISSAAKPSLDAMPMHVYSTVIQQLKEQKKELQEQSQADLQRARASENLSQEVLANLDCGVVVFDSRGLVKMCNPAAKEILGFASATGMSADDIFRGAVISGDGGQAQETMAGDEAVCLADEVAIMLHTNCRREVEAEFETPAGERKHLGVTVSSLRGEGMQPGVACMIHDHSELDRLRREVEAARGVAVGAGSASS